MPVGETSCGGPITTGVPTVAAEGMLMTWITTIPGSTAGAPTAD